MFMVVAPALESRLWAALAASKSNLVRVEMTPTDGTVSHIFNIGKLFQPYPSCTVSNICIEFQTAHLSLLLALVLLLQLARLVVPLVVPLALVALVQALPGDSALVAADLAWDPSRLLPQVRLATSTRIATLFKIARMQTSTK